MQKNEGSKVVKWILIAVSVLFAFVFLILPLYTVISVALRNGVGKYFQYITDKDTISAVKLTAKATLSALVVNTFFGLFAAWFLTMFQFKGKKVLTTLIDIPVTVSPVIAGLIFILVFGRQSVLYPYLQQAGIKVVFAVPGIILATIFVTFPFISREIIPILEEQGTEEEAAALMGASGFTIFRKVTFPHIKWALLYGVVLCTARAMGEFGAVSVLSGHLRGKTNTLPLQVEILFGDNKYVPAFAVASILVILAVIILRVNDLAASKRGIGFVFQNYALFRYMTVYDNIAFGLRVQKADKKKIDERVRELIKLIGLEGLEKRYPSQLSGGQRQRVAFARALAPNPQLLLLDEPFAAIDAKVRKELRSWLREMIEKLGVTSIFVTHDQDEAIEVADEIIITNKGRIEQTGTPIEIYHNPKTAFTASFFGETTFVDDYSKFHNFEHIENAEKAIVRPEFVKVTKKNEVQKYKSSASHGVTKNVLFRGDSIEVVVDVDGTELKARRGLDEQAIEVGEEVDVFLYRIFVTVGDKAYLLDNKSISEDSLVI